MKRFIFKLDGGRIVKKRVLLVISIFALFFSVSSCGLIDELKGLSIYSDFIFAFQKEWKEQNSTGAWLKASTQAATLYEVDLEGVAGKVGIYSGKVNVGYVVGKPIFGEGDQTYFRIKAELNVVGQGKTPISNTSAMVIEAMCMNNGLIIDGYALLKNEDPTTLAVYTQAANLEGLYIFLQQPTVSEAPEPAPEPTPDPAP